MMIDEKLKGITFKKIVFYLFVFSLFIFWFGQSAFADGGYAAIPSGSLDPNSGNEVV